MAIDDINNNIDNRKKNIIRIELAAENGGMDLFAEVGVAAE